MHGADPEQRLTRYGPPGSGLQGLAERARAVRGRVDARPLDRGGFRLAVSVPTSANALGAVIRVLIAEDQGMVRGALASLLVLEHDIEVVAQVVARRRGRSRRGSVRPDVALLDIEMPGQTGLDAAGELTSSCRTAGS